MAEKLRQAMKDADNMSQRELAKRLAGKAATPQRRENVRRQVAKWLNGTKPEAENAQRLARIFDKPADYFVTTRQAQKEEMAQLRDDFDALRLELRQRVRRIEKLIDAQEPPQDARGGS